MDTLNFCPRCASTLTRREDGGRLRQACSDEACGYVLYDNPTPVVAAVVEHEGDVVLIRNQGWPASWFGLVAGFLEQGEEPATGMLREIEEEVGLRGEIVGLIGLYTFAQMNQLIIAYHVRAEGTLTLGPEIAAVKRVPPDELEPWPIGTGPAVRDWLAARTAASTSS